jgi:hypothetical protein
LKDFIEKLYIATEEQKLLGRKKRTTKEFTPIKNNYNKILREAKRGLNVFEGIKILYDSKEKDPIYSILGQPS